MSGRLQVVLASAALILVAAIVAVVGPHFERVRVIAVLPPAPCIVPDIPVLYLGANVGRVTSVEAHQDRVVLVLSLTRSDLPLTRGDRARIAIGTSDDRAVEIVRSKRREPPLVPHRDTLLGDIPFRATPSPNAKLVPAELQPLLLGNQTDCSTGSRPGLGA